MVKYKRYRPEYDAWQNISELGDVAQHLKNYKKRIKIVTTLDRQHPGLNILKTILKHATKKQDIKSASAIAILTSKSTFITLASKNIVSLQ